jgi:AcrR family transcriptional regulator
MNTESLSKGERTRQVIQDAAYHLFLEQGYSASSMRQIAEAAGLAVSGIYNHFASKDEIFEAIVHDRHPYKQILPVLIAAPGVTTEEFVRNAAQALVDELGRRPDFLKLMFIEIVEFNTEHLPGIFEEILPQVLPLIQRLQSSANSIRSIHPALVLRAFLGMFFSFYITEAMLGETMPAELREHGFDSFVDIFLHGILLPVAEE